MSGRDKTVHADEPDDWFSDDEISLRAYKNINNYEYALYSYWGYWKTPAGTNDSGTKIFPELNVYGASARGAVFKGIGNLEIAYYNSLDDKGGTNSSIPNSQMRYLIGYTQDIAKDFNLSIQYYIEHILDYHDYEKNIESSLLSDEVRHLMTLQGTKLLFNQNLEISVPFFYSPTDRDVYISDRSSRINI